MSLNESLHVPAHKLCFQTIVHVSRDNDVRSELSRAQLVCGEYGQLITVAILTVDRRTGSILFRIPRLPPVLGQVYTPMDVNTERVTAAPPPVWAGRWLDPFRCQRCGRECETKIFFDNFVIIPHFCSDKVFVCSGDTKK